MPETPVSARVSARRTQAALSAMDKRVGVFTASATKQAGSKIASTVKSGMRGRPRWDRRGKSSRTGPEVNLNLSPHHVTKGGGPGQLSGSLRKSIRKSRKVRKEAGGYSIAVMSGGAGGPQNLYKRRVEAKQPYFAKGVKKAEPKIPPIFEAAWAKATKTK